MNTQNKNKLPSIHINYGDSSQEKKPIRQSISKIKNKYFQNYLEEVNNIPRYKISIRSSKKNASNIKQFKKLKSLNSKLVSHEKLSVSQQKYLNGVFQDNLEDYSNQTSLEDKKTANTNRNSYLQPTLRKIDGSAVKQIKQMHSIKPNHRSLKKQKGTIKNTIDDLHTEKQSISDNSSLKQSKLSIYSSDVPTIIVRSPQHIKNSGIIKNKYAIIKRISNDEFIYKCVDLEANAIRCLKIYPLSIFVNQNDKQTMAFHLENLVSFQIENLVPIYDYFFDTYYFEEYQKKENCFFIVCEHYECGNLRNFIGKLQIWQIGKIYNQIRSAIQKLHRQNILHGQINTYNIFLDINLNAYLSTPIINYKKNHQQPLFVAINPKNTEAYESYQKLLDKNSENSKIDLWGLGMVLIELVYEDTIQQILKHQWIKVPAYNKHFPKDQLKNLTKFFQFKEVIQKLLTYQPSKRHFINIDIPKPNLKSKTNLQKYKLLKRLKNGGQAEIYSCIDLIQNMIKIIKIMPIELTEIQSSKNKQEGEILSKFNHPNIIKIYEYFYDNFTYQNTQKTFKSIFIVQQLLEGGQLTNYLGYLQNNHIFPLYNQIKSALNYSHSLGVIHRDISLDNILFDKNLNAILTDFGIASLSNNITLGVVTNYCTGKDIYRSYELLKENKAYDKSDLWAFGIVLLQLIYGKPLNEFRKKCDHFIPSMDDKFPKEQLQNINQHELAYLVESLLKRDYNERKFI